MQIRRWFVGAIVGTLVVLALAPAAAQAAGPPEVTSVICTNCGSAGGCKVLIRGRNFEGVTEVRFGTVRATKIITTGTPTKGQCKGKSTTEIECFSPFHECGRFHVTVSTLEGTSAEIAADEAQRAVECRAHRTRWHAPYGDGCPFLCKEAHKIVLTEFPGPSEREVGVPEGCSIRLTPAPAGCVQVGLYSNPPLNVNMEYEGYVEPLIVNGSNGLSPSSWEFEGHAKGEHVLCLRETPSTEGSATGSLKILGYAGQELISVK
jgi:hypothetical protein